MARGAIEGCETWTNRILHIVEIESAELLSILDLPRIEVLGLNEVEITTSILDVIERDTGVRPQTLSIKLIDSEPEYESLLDLYLASLKLLLDGKCPRQWKGREYHYEEQIDKIRREELSRSVV